MDEVKYPTFMEIETDEKTMAAMFVGEIAKSGDAVELVCTERSAGKMTLQLRVKKD